MLFDESTLRKLNRLTLVARQVRAGIMKGERRSTRRGTSIEFADYRNYSPGDDLRRLDWNVYARLDRPFLKLFEEEEDLAVHLLLDGSQSMDWGEGDSHKFTYARRMAAALGVIALVNGDRLTTTVLHASGNNPQFGPSRGQPSTLPLLQFLEAQQIQGMTDLTRSLRDYAFAARRPGLAIIISDLFSSDGYLHGLTHLQNRGYEVALLHILAPTELDPPIAGDLRLIDVETGQAQEVSLDAGTRALYHRQLQEWQADIAAACRKRGVRYIHVDSGVPWERFLLQELRKVGIVQ